MTEDEARKKECPIYVATLVFVIIRASDPDEASKTLHEQQFCRGSTCMMWRGRALDGTQYGYCGLAGAGR